MFHDVSWTCVECCWFVWWCFLDVFLDFTWFYSSVSIKFNMFELNFSGKKTTFDKLVRIYFWGGCGVASPRWPVMRPVVGHETSRSNTCGASKSGPDAFLKLNDQTFKSAITSAKKVNAKMDKIFEYESEQHGEKIFSSRVSALRSALESVKVAVSL